MKPVNRQSGIELEYNENDARDAILANPFNQKCRQYHREYNSCVNERQRRRVVRQWRHDQRTLALDPLDIMLHRYTRERRRIQNTCDFNTRTLRNARYNLAWKRVK